MKPRADMSRREFLKGAFREREAVGPTGTGHDCTTPAVPEWERAMDQVLEAMNDLGGIEEP